MHIGGNSTGMSIGGADSIVVRSPLKNQPYIPGSSLKGKLRSLVERVRGDEEFNDDGGFSTETKDGRTNAFCGTRGDTLLGKIFGVSADSKNNKNEPTRLIVRDCSLTSQSAKLY